MVQYSQKNNQDCGTFFTIMNWPLKKTSLVKLWLLGLMVAGESQSNWLLENLHGPSQVGIVDNIPVDINKDGLMDVVSLSIEDGDLRAYINQGNLVFEQQYISEDVDGGFRLTATDINGDGAVDFLVPSIETHEIIAFIATKKGYSKQIIASDVLLPTDAQAADFNKDGLVDVVSLSFQEDTVLYHRQLSHGQFDTVVLADKVVKPRKIALIEANNDGSLDFLVASSDDDSVRLFENDGQGGFNVQVVSNEAGGAWYVTTCDFDNNEHMDFIVSATNDNQVKLFVNAGNSNFNLHQLEYNLATPRALQCADVDDDGFTEMLAISGADDTIHLYQLSELLNDEVIANARDGYISLNAVDFNDDGQLDVLTQAFFEQRNLIYFPSLNQEVIVWQDFPDGLTSIQVDTDVPGSYYYDAFRSGAIFNYLGGLIEQVFDGSRGIRALLLSDMNQDNFLDIFSVNSETDEAIGHLNDGAGNYIPNVLFNQLQFPTASQTVEILGQQKTVVATTFDEFFWVFDAMSVSSLGNSFSGSFALDVADINNDQLDDIIIADYIGGKINLAIQDSQGQFQVLEVSSNKPRVFSVKAIDMDNDADLDIVSSVNQTNEVWWHENTNMNFTDHLITSQIAGPRDLDVHERMGVKYIAVSSFVPGGGIYLINTIAGSQFTVNKIHTNIHGINTLKFIAQPGGLGLLAGGFNNGSFSRLTQIDLIFKDSFE